MTLIRLILLVLVGYLARRVYLALKPAARTGGETSTAPPRDRTRAGVKDLTDQDIDDADFEEIP